MEENAQKSVSAPGSCANPGAWAWVGRGSPSAPPERPDTQAVHHSKPRGPWRWLLAGVVGAALVGLAAWPVPLDTASALFFVDYWAPWLMAALLGLLLIRVELAAAAPSGRSNRAHAVVGLVALLVCAATGVGRMAGWIGSVGDSNMLHYSRLMLRLPPLPDVLRDGAWATQGNLSLLLQTRGQYPNQVTVIDQYVAAWYFWHRDPLRGEQALWQLGMQAPLVRYYESKGAWEIVGQIAQGQYLTSTGEPLDSGRLAALRALARRAGGQQQVRAASQYLLEAFARSGRAGAEEQKRLWSQMDAAVGETVSYGEYYRSLRQLATQVKDRDVLARTFFEMRKLEQLHPELARVPQAAVQPASLPASVRVSNGGVK